MWFRLALQAKALAAFVLLLITQISAISEGICGIPGSNHLQPVLVKWAFFMLAS